MSFKDFLLNEEDELSEARPPKLGPDPVKVSRDEQAAFEKQKRKDNKLRNWAKRNPEIAAIQRDAEERALRRESTELEERHSAGHNQMVTDHVGRMTVVDYPVPQTPGPIDYTYNADDDIPFDETDDVTEDEIAGVGLEPDEEDELDDAVDEFKDLQKEEFEYLGELSQGTLERYADKAKKSQAKLYDKSRKHDYAGGGRLLDLDRKAYKRGNAVTLAKAKIQKIKKANAPNISSDTLKAVHSVVRDHGLDVHHTFKGTDGNHLRVTPKVRSNGEEEGVVAKHWKLADKINSSLKKANLHHVASAYVGSHKEGGRAYQMIPANEYSHVGIKVHKNLNEEFEALAEEAKPGYYCVKNGKPVGKSFSSAGAAHAAKKLKGDDDSEVMFHNGRGGWMPVDSKGKRLQEDFEQLDELSKNTLISYQKKNLNHQQALENERESHPPKSSRSIEIGKKKQQRAKGYRRADFKLQMKESPDSIIEDFEQLDELSKKTLASYIDKASHNYLDLAHENRVGFKKFANPQSAEAKAHRDLLKKMNKRSNSLVSARNKLTKEDLNLTEARLDKVNIVHHDNSPEAKKFARDYVAGFKGDYASGGPSDKDVKNSEKFHNEYDTKHTRSGFAGSGTTVYTHKKTGNKFEVDRNPNGKSFYGTNHSIRHLHEDLNLTEAVDNFSTLQHMVQNREHDKDLTFKNGQSVNVKNDEARALLDTHRKLASNLKDKFRDMINKDPGSFMIAYRTAYKGAH